MKRSAQSRKWAQLVVDFHQTPGLKRLGVVFADACNCGGKLHRWGNRPDVRCPARAAKRNQSRMDALGEVIRGR